MDPRHKLFSKLCIKLFFFWKVYYRENSPLNFLLIISNIKKFMNIFEKSNFPEIFKFLNSLN